MSVWKALRKTWRRHRLAPPYRAWYEASAESAEDGLVSIDCETTSLKVREAELLAIAAVRVRGNRICASEAFHVLVKPDTPAQAGGNEAVRIHGLRPRDLEAGLTAQEAVTQLLEFIGGRTLLGYYLEYDLAVLNKYLKPLLGAALPNDEIEVSGRYYDWQMAEHPGGYIDLRWDAMAEKLGTPKLARHDAMNDAVSAAMMYLALRARGFG